jgi:hypothetical protein
MAPQHLNTLSAYLLVCCILSSSLSTGQCASLQALRRNARSVSLLESEDRDRLGSLTGPVHAAASSARKMLQAPAPSPIGSAGLVNVSAIFAFGDSTTDTGEGPAYFPGSAFFFQGAAIRIFFGVCPQLTKVIRKGDRLKGLFICKPIRVGLSVQLKGARLQL